ncbi:MAG: TonB-dependent siderophore receptor [Comamonas sp.]
MPLAPASSVLSSVSSALRRRSAVARACAALSLGLHLQLAAAQSLSLDVPAQPLATALSQFARQAGLQLTYASDLVQGRQSQALSGRYELQQGLAQLLQGSGLQGRIAGGTLTLEPIPAAAPSPAPAQDHTLPVVTVSAGDQYVNLLPAPYAGGQVAKGVRLGVLGNTSNMDAPFSTTSYTAQAVRDQQASTIAEAVNRDPSVRYTVLPGGNVDNLYIRGFPIWEGNSGEIAFDGIYGIAPNYRVRTEYVDRIEVIKGPGALLFGMSPNGSVGGVINIAPKRANEEVARLTVGHSSDGLWHSHADVGRRFGDEGQYGIRINASKYQGDTVVEQQRSNGHVLALALDYEVAQFRATLDILSQDERIDGVGRPIMPSGLSALPAAPSGKRNASQAWEWSDNRERAVLLRTEFDVTEQLTVFANVGQSRADVDRLYDSAPRLTSAAGATSSTPTYAVFDVDRSTIDAGLRSRFALAGVKHSVTLQLASYREEFHRALQAGSTIGSNIYAPIAHSPQNIARPSAIPRIHDNRNTSLALVDTLALLDDRLQLSMGLRHQMIKSTNFNALSGATANVYDERVTTPALGVVWRQAPNWSLYANYIEGLSKGDIAPPSASNYGEVLRPYKSRQYEIGSKYDLGSFMATAALFSIEKPSGGLNQGVYQSNGEQRNLGMELYAYGEAAKGLRLLGGLTVLKPEITRAATAALVGNRPIGTSRLLANVGLEWDVPALQGLSLIGDLAYTGAQFADQANQLRIPAWTRADLGLRYSTRIADRKTTLRATVQNVANRNAWAGVTSWGAVSPMVPRTFVVSASVDF